MYHISVVCMYMYIYMNNIMCCHMCSYIYIYACIYIFSCVTIITIIKEERRVRGVDRFFLYRK